MLVYFNISSILTRNENIYKKDGFFLFREKWLKYVFHLRYWWIESWHLQHTVVKSIIAVCAMIRFECGRQERNQHRYKQQEFK